MAGERGKKLSHKQRKLVRALPRAASISEAGRIAGYRHAQSAHRALEAITRKMPEILDKHGLSDDYLVEKCLKPGLKARETKFFAHEGVVTDEREVVAWSERRQFLEIAFRLKGAFPKPDSSLNIGNVNYVFTLRPDFSRPDAVRPLPAVRQEPETKQGGATPISSECRKLKN